MFEDRGNITLYEKSEGVSYDVKDGVLNITADKGYAVFIY